MSKWKKTIDRLVDQVRDQRGDYLEALEELADMARAVDGA